MHPAAFPYRITGDTSAPDQTPRIISRISSVPISPSTTASAKRSGARFRPSGISSRSKASASGVPGSIAIRGRPLFACVEDGGDDDNSTGALGDLLEMWALITRLPPVAVEDRCEGGRDHLGVDDFLVVLLRGKQTRTARWAATATAAPWWPSAPPNSLERVRLWRCADHGHHVIDVVAVVLDVEVLDPDEPAGCRLPGRGFSR